ncbi:MAG: hypothetical protein H0T79_08165, partial [Deltaproteobacteria bacterium]|nr:hypothetical protein [Deltaproteobacteria bacterium]
RDTVVDAQGSPNLMINSSFIDRMPATDDPSDAPDDGSADAAEGNEIGGCQVGGGGAGLLVALALFGICLRRR